MYPCIELSHLPSTFWKNHSLILLPQSQMIAKDLHLNIDSRVYSLTDDGFISEIYQVMPMRKANSSVIGNIKQKNFQANVQTIWERRSNLQNIHLNIVYANVSPYSIIENDTSKITGYFGDIFNILQEKLNFNFTLIRNDVFGRDEKGNCSFDGMIGMLQAGVGNWSISQFSYLEERSRCIDYSWPISYDPKKLVTKKPNEDYNWMAYVQVFAKQFWLVLFSSTIILAFSLYVALRYSNTCVGASPTALMFPIASLCCREISPIKARLSGRILIVFILGWGFLISSAYNAILTSVLAVSKVTPLLSFEDLLNSETYTFLLRSSGATVDYFKNAENTGTCKIINN